MSSCIGLGGHCCCMKVRVKWCEHCQLWICRWMYRGHICMVPDARKLWNARQGLINWLHYRIYRLREQAG
jgi:hypothetical protein